MGHPPRRYPQQQETIHHVTRACCKLGVRATLNLGATDGRAMAFTRCSTEGPGNSLCFVEDERAFPAAVVVTSEHLDADEEWCAVPDRHLLAVGEDGASLRPS